jgi:uncharacterized SAM-binding protein YcdF (DUF218 family)
MEKVIAFGIIRLILIVIGSLSIINGILYTLVISRVNIGSNIQILISIGIILYAILLNKIPPGINITVGIICLLPILFIIFLFVYGNTGILTYNEDVVIVMGAGVIGERVSLQLASRLDTAIEYMKKNPKALVIVCGGLGDRATITEAEAMRRYLEDFGIAPERIIKENRSTNSFENLVFANSILKGYFSQGYRAVLVTSDYHIFRTSYVASNIGINANRLGAATPFISVPSSYLREMLAIANVIIFPPWRIE